MHVFGNHLSILEKDLVIAMAKIKDITKSALRRAGDIAGDGWYFGDDESKNRFRHLQFNYTNNIIANWVGGNFFTGIMLLLNAVLGIMAKVSPQMNMFAVGLQLKVLVGLCVLFITVRMLPGIADFIYTEMKQMMVAFVQSMM